MSAHIEPAIKSYFFGKGYTDLTDVIRDSWKRNTDSAKEFFSKIKKNTTWWEVSLSFVFWGGAGISVIVFGTVFFAAVSLLHIVFLCSLFLLIYIGFTIVWTIERTFLLCRRFFAACPYCHEKNTLPEYLCNNCGNVHAKLTPNKYGILYHKCTCGQKLAATFFVNRGRLQARCPNLSCHQFLHREHIETRRIFIPILGGPSAGKTVFMFAVVRKLIEGKASEFGFTPEFIDKNTEAEYKKIVGYIKKGHVPGKTQDNIPKAFNLALKKDRKTKWLMYIYDPSGEAYQNMQNLSAHRYHAYLSGMILIIDPFSIPSVRRNYENQLSKTWSSVKPSQLSVETALSRVILTMEESFGLSKTAKIKKPLAIVLSKVDAFGLEELIGESAISKALYKTEGSTRAELRDRLIRQQLIDWGEEPLIQQLDTRFKNVRYFSCSALGRIPDSTGRDLVPHHVFEPVLWLCNSVNSKDFELSNQDKI